MAKMLSAREPAAGGLRRETFSAAGTMGAALNQRGLRNSLRWASSWHFTRGANTPGKSESTKRLFERVRANLGNAFQQKSAIQLIRVLAQKKHEELRQFTGAPPEIDLDDAARSIARDRSLLNKVAATGFRKGLSLASFLAEKGDHRALFEQWIADALERACKPKLGLFKGS